MSDELEILHDKLSFRYRGLKAAGAFFDPPPPAVLEVLRLFDMRDYVGCKKKTGELINAGAWVAFGSAVATGCDQCMALVPKVTSVEVLRK